MAEAAPEKKLTELEISQQKIEAAEKALAAREAALIEKEADLKALADSSGNRPVRPSEAVCIGEGYLFEVRPKKADAGLPTKEIRCIDESEALRWYVATTPSPENPTKQVDPVKHQLEAICKDPARAERRNAALRLALIRSKAERGVPLTPEEELDLNRAEMIRMQGL